jgi:hypothetical protein
LATDKEILTSVKPGKPPADCPVLGTWRLRTYVRERLSDGQRHNQFGDAPVGYIGYAPDGRMYAIFTRDDRVVPRDVVPTDEEGVQLLGSMVAYAGTFSLGENVVVHRHFLEPGVDRDKSNSALRAGGRYADDHDRPLQKLPGWHHGPINSRLEQGRMMPRPLATRDLP